MKKILNASVSRRGVLAGSLAGAGMLAMPSILKAQDKSLKVGV
ncbi:MAG: ABC transporter substrate-binding protein, partial [Rhizobium sp.]|nr:ABC transporter substrate-binding protein [Rhizobium sp.]